MGIGGFLTLFPSVGKEISEPSDARKRISEWWDFLNTDHKKFMVHYYPSLYISAYQCAQVRQAKPGISHKLKGVYHDNVVPIMKPTGGERSNPQAEARNGERVSRNNRELDSASLH